MRTGANLPAQSAHASHPSSATQQQHKAARQAPRHPPPHAPPCFFCCCWGGYCICYDAHQSRDRRLSIPTYGDLLVALEGLVDSHLGNRLVVDHSFVVEDHSSVGRPDNVPVASISFSILGRVDVCEILDLLAEAGLVHRIPEVGLVGSNLGSTSWRCFWNVVSFVSQMANGQRGLCCAHT